MGLVHRMYHTQCYYLSDLPHSGQNLDFGVISALHSGHFPTNLVYSGSSFSRTPSLRSCRVQMSFIPFMNGLIVSGFFKTLPSSHDCLNEVLKEALSFSCLLTRFLMYSSNLSSSGRCLNGSLILSSGIMIGANTTGFPILYVATHALM